MVGFLVSNGDHEKSVRVMAWFWLHKAHEPCRGGKADMELVRIRKSPVISNFGEGYPS